MSETTDFHQELQEVRRLLSTCRLSYTSATSGMSGQLAAAERRQDKLERRIERLDYRLRVLTEQVKAIVASE